MNVDFAVPAGVTLWVARKQGQSGPYLSLDMIKVAEDRRRQGLGDAVMRDLCAEADRLGVPIALTPGNDFGTSKAFLTRWYRSFGFVPNTGPRADNSISGSMIRFPK